MSYLVTYFIFVNTLSYFRVLKCNLQLATDWYSLDNFINSSISSWSFLINFWVLLFPLQTFKFGLLSKEQFFSIFVWISWNSLPQHQKNWNTSLYSHQLNFFLYQLNIFINYKYLFDFDKWETIPPKKLLRPYYFLLMKMFNWYRKKFSWWL